VPRPRPRNAQLASFQTGLLVPRRPGPQTAGGFARMAPGPLMPGAWHLALPARAGQGFQTLALVSPLPHFAGSGWQAPPPVVFRESALPVAIADASWSVQARARRGMFTSAPLSREVIPLNRPAAARVATSGGIWRRRAR